MTPLIAFWILQRHWCGGVRKQMWLRFKNLMLWCHSSLRQPKRWIVVLLIVKESFPLWQWAFSGRKRRGEGASLTRHALHQHTLLKPGWFVYLFIHHCAPPYPLFSFWLKIDLDYSNMFSLYPVGNQFHVKRIMLANLFPCGTKLHSHSPVKGGPW